MALAATYGKKYSSGGNSGIGETIECTARAVTIVKAVRGSMMSILFSGS